MTNMNPQNVWNSLKEGNQRFIEERAEHPNIDQTRRVSLVTGQDPKVVVLSCSDSRVPVELVFDMGLGDAFVIRTAGHIVDRSEEHTSELQSRGHLVCRLLLEKKKKKKYNNRKIFPRQVMTYICTEYQVLVS